MLKAGFFLIAFIVYCGNWSVSAEVKDIQKKCEGSGCFGFAVKYFEEKKFDEAFTYSSIACIGDASGHMSGACSLVFDLARMDKKRLDKARMILKQRCELKDVNSVEDCMRLGILELKKGNNLDADNLFKEACNSPKNCAITASLLDMEHKGKAIEMLHKCEALGGHPNCFMSLSSIAQEKADCVGHDKLLERACEFKKDPNACKEWVDYQENKLPKCMGVSETTCWKLYRDSKVLTLRDACEVQETAVYACESLIHRKKSHNHKESARLCAGGDNNSCHHLAFYFERNDPEQAKKIKCGFGVLDGCGKIK